MDLVPTEIDEATSTGHPKVEEKPQDFQLISKRTLVYQEIIRGVVTLVFVLILAAVLGFAAWASLNADQDHWKRVSDLLQIILPVLTTLLGSALGFYFGAKK